MTILETRDLFTKRPRKIREPKPREISAEQLRQVLVYEPENGHFRWRKTRGRSSAGRVAGCIRPDGYRLIGVGGSHYLAHRLAFLWMTGKWPREHVDHINRVRDDNRWANLREATLMQNAWNGRRHKDNRSGFKGVSWSQSRHIWRARIQKHKKQVILGYFRAPEEAYAAYCEAAKVAFGEYARFE